MAVILNIVGFNTTKINCQVSFVPHLWLVILSNTFSKVWITFFAVSASVMYPGCNAQYLILFFFPVLCLHCLYHCFTVDCSSCVRLICITIILPKALKESWQNRHLEQGKDYFCNRNGHVDDGYFTLHQW